MGKYAITFARSARKEIEDLPSHVVSRVLSRIELLAGNPRPDGCRKLRGEPNPWRIRVGDWRAIYTVDDSQRVVDIVAVRHRSQVYR